MGSSFSAASTNADPAFSWPYLLSSTLASSLMI